MNTNLLQDIQTALWNHIETADVVVPGAVALRNEVDLLLSAGDRVSSDDAEAIVAAAKAIGLEVRS